MAPKKKKKFQQPSFSRPISLCHQEELAALFNKKFALKTHSDNNWTLPNSNLLFVEEAFVVANMLHIKEELNRTKSLLNDRDINDWHQHTRRTNKAGFVVHHLRNNLHPEMCTQAWAKFHEIINTYNLIPEEALRVKSFNTVHLCEAPGAFITSLNHFLKSHNAGLGWKWVATTLNPYYEGHDLGAMLNDDRFISETLQHWNFGKDSTGDIMNKENLHDLQTSCEALGSIHMVTADGSIDCADQPAEQENVVAQLIYCEAVIALTLLEKGGSFVFKMFTALEHQMICLLYLLSCAFSEVSFIKPGTSKAGNSEVYVVCCGFKSMQKLPNGYGEKLIEAFHPHSPSCSMFPLSEIPEDFISRLWDCEQYFTNLQMAAILTNIQSYDHMSHSDSQSLKQLRHLVAIDYTDRFSVRAISKGDFIVQSSTLDNFQLNYTQRIATNQENSDKLDSRHHVGSYNERHSGFQSTWIEKAISSQFAPDLSQPHSLEELTRSKIGEQLLPLAQDQVDWLQLAYTSLTTGNVRQWQPLTGKTVDKVRNSCFCASPYVTYLDECRRSATILHPENLQALKRISRQLCHFNLASNWSCTEQEASVLNTLVGIIDVNCRRAINVGTPSSGIELFLKKEKLIEHIIHYRVSDSECCPPCSMLIFGNIKFNNDSKENSLGSEELTTKQELLDQLTVAMRLLRPGGTFVCNIFELLTRFSVGLLFVLHHLFEKVAVVKPLVSRLWHPERFLVCKGFQGCDEHILDFLETIRNRLAEVVTSSDGTKDVLEIVSMKHLHEQRFYKFIKQSNQQIAQLQIQNIIRLESQFAVPSCSSI